MVRIKEVEALSNHRLRLTLTSGITIERDVANLLVGPVFDAIRHDPELFSQVRAEHGTAVWPGGVDLCPDVLIWNGPPPASSSTKTLAFNRKKIAKLMETEEGSGKVDVLVKLHDWAGRAIYLYNLRTHDMIHIRKPTPQQWDKYSKSGVPIPHPRSLRASDVAAWVHYRKQEAKRRGLSIAE
jgi:Protein of unknown function (DUF2442)